MADALRTWLGQNFGTTVIAGATSVSLNAADTGLAWLFQPYSADPITHLGFRYGARTGTPPTYLIRLEGVDASGLPDGADVGGGSPTSVTFTPPADTTIDGTWLWKTLTNAYTPSRGQFLCSTIRHSSGSVDGSNFSSITSRIAGISATGRGMLYHLTMSGGTWTKNANPVCFGWRTASGRFGYIGTSVYNTQTANTATHRSGMYFTLPSGHGSTYKILGLSFCGKLGVAAGSCKVAIYSTDGTLQQSVTVDSDHEAQAPGASMANVVIFADATLYDFAYGTKYYAVIEVISGTIVMAGINLAEAADRSAYPNGTNRGLVTNAGSWVETDTVMPTCELILDDITVPSGGGLLIHGGMTGGLRG